MKIKSRGRNCLFLALIVLAATNSSVQSLKSEKLCGQCGKCETSKCPGSDEYPHMTAFDERLIAGALQSDYVNATDRGVYSVPDVKGRSSSKFNAYFGWQSTSGSTSGYNRFSNYMDKCSSGQNYLTVDKHGTLSLRSLESLESLAEADWKSINPPEKLNHRGFRFWMSHNTGKCLTVLDGKKKTNKRSVGVADCKFDGSNPFQLFAFRFHYHKAFCCCGVHND